MKSRAFIPVVLILALAAAAAGCGGSSGTSGGSGSTSSHATRTTPSMTKFAAKITAICTKGNNKIAKTGFTLGSYGSAANEGQAASDLQADEIDELKSLQPPDEIKSQVEDFIEKAETSHDKLRKLVRAAKNFDAKGVTQLTPEVSAANRDVRNAAKSFGATC